MRAALLVFLLLAACTPPPREATRSDLAGEGGAVVATDDPSGDAAEMDASAPSADAHAPEDAGPTQGSGPWTFPSAWAEDAQAPGDAGPTEPSGPSACPATKADAKGACVRASPAQVCAYADAICTCEPGRYCGGPVPPPHVLAEAQKPRWVCRPPPGSIRPDGCPANQPSGKCSAPGKTCQYSDCCGFTYRCEGGSWQRIGVTCPP